MKEIIYILILFAINQFSWSQNILLNADFESYSMCPTNTSQLDRVNSWNNVVVSPDYYNCSFVSFPAISNSGLAYTGKGFVGILTFGDTNSSTEAFGQTLSQTLLPNHIYQLTIAAKHTGTGSYSNSCTGVELFGFNSNYVAPTTVVHVSQLPGAMALGSTLVISDTTWQVHTINLTVADSTNFIVFTLKKVANCKEYVFIDGLDFRDTGLLTTGINSKSETNDLRIYCDPLTGEVFISSDNNITSLTILNSMGQIAYRSFPQEKTINFRIQKPGVYYAFISGIGKTENKKFVIVQ